MFEIGKTILHQREAALRGLDKLEPGRDRRLIAIDPDHLCAGHLENRARMPAGAERAVDVNAFAWAKLFEYLAGKHGNMTGQSASGRLAGAARHHSPAFCASRAATREPSCFFNARTVPVASASCARKRPGSQI